MTPEQIEARASSLAVEWGCHLLGLATSAGDTDAAEQVATLVLGRLLGSYAIATGRPHGFLSEVGEVVTRTLAAALPHPPMTPPARRGRRHGG